LTIVEAVAVITINVLPHNQWVSNKSYDLSHAWIPKVTCP